MGGSASGGGMGMGMPGMSGMQHSDNPTLQAEAGYNVVDSLSPEKLLGGIMGMIGSIGQGKTKQMTYTVGSTGQPLPMQQMPSQDLTAFLRAFNSGGM